MMNRILSNAITASRQGHGGYAVAHDHYNQYHGMRKVVDRLVRSGLVQKRDADAGRFLLEPTKQAFDLLQQDNAAAA